MFSNTQEKGNIGIIDQTFVWEEYIKLEAMLWLMCYIKSKFSWLLNHCCIINNNDILGLATFIKLFIDSKIGKMITSPYNTSMSCNQLDLVFKKNFLRNIYPFKTLRCNIHPTTYWMPFHGRTIKVEGLFGDFSFSFI